MRRIERRRVRLASAYRQFIEQFALVSAAVAAGDLKLASSRVSKAWEVAAKLADTLAALDESPTLGLHNYFPKRVRKAA